MTRSWIALAHGDLLTAFRYHPFGPPFFLFTLVWLIASLPASMGTIASLRIGIHRVLRSPTLMKSLAVAFLGVWVLRLYLTHLENTFFLW
jgi:hypothetical protein